MQVRAISRLPFLSMFHLVLDRFSELRAGASMRVEGCQSVYTTRDCIDKVVTHMVFGNHSRIWLLTASSCIVVFYSLNFRTQSLRFLEMEAGMLLPDDRYQPPQHNILLE